MRRLIRWIVLATICYCVIMWLPEGVEEYGPHPPTRIEKLEAENATIRARLTELEANQRLCPWNGEVK